MPILEFVTQLMIFKATMRQFYDAVYEMNFHKFYYIYFRILLRFEIPYALSSITHCCIYFTFTSSTLELREVKTKPINHAYYFVWQLYHYSRIS